MAEKTDPEPQDVEWVSLTKAFNDVGRMKFGVVWDEETIYLSPGRYRLDMMDEGIPIRIDYSMKHNYPEEWREYLDDLPHEHPIASEEMIAHYDKTKELLLNAIWERKITVEAIARDGDISEVPLKAWKDTTGAFEISFPDSEVLNSKEDGSWETWRVQINLNNLQDFLKIVDAERRDAVRRRAANENPNKGGAPFKYDWSKIEQCTAEELRQSAKDTSYRKIAKQVATRLKEMGIDPPVDSQLRALAKEVRETGLK